MEEYTMTFRTNRLYCMLTKSFWAELIPSLLFLALGMFLVWSQGEKLRTAILVFPVAMVLIGLSHISRQPKEFTVNDSELTLSLNLKKKLPPYVRVNKKTGLGRSSSWCSERSSGSNAAALAAIGWAISVCTERCMHKISTETVQISEIAPSTWSYAVCRIGRKCSIG